ncbi:hypothetical protein K493DRAFT_391012 [Basidiobolus meristosporus CBS 931.73]|uniref:Uncharacterized protein n=1 Tax=Basidiobolus meristosporus CBS 931.73 TaxID=1314790 RepID=A0A1Y1YRX3_9FUNG|nr:hypothetical protein K493DRAFT_391012 [Basidiobolus meristosporus CBS 931.73]|eukprot:ORY00719.1 hypothetical protein K493DRAFT_391012 [Basidiobolus meristosporus CBS 931.73]
MKYSILLFASLASAATMGVRPLMKDVLKVQNPVSIMDLPGTSDPLDAYAPDCIKTVNAGAATVQTQLYEQGCALITFSVESSPRITNSIVVVQVYGFESMEQTGRPFARQEVGWPPLPASLSERQHLLH